MSKRRETLKAMMAPIAHEPSDAPEEDRRAPTRSGSLKSMGLALQGLSDEADEARVLRKQIADGAHVLELEASLIDPSFIRDRLKDDHAVDFEILRESLAEHGQQSPILVRPNPQMFGRYQAAYGHRRLAALRELGLPVKAIVRDLTDEQLVIAQGKENLERRDLSFIERALFAMRLEDGGFSRMAVMAALAVHKGNLSTMISVARALPEDLIVRIGPAPKVGRLRWEELAQLLTRKDAEWRSVVTALEFEQLDSDARFTLVLKALRERRKNDGIYGQISYVQDAEGRRIIKTVHKKGRLTMAFDERVAPNFGDYVATHLPEIFAAFQRGETA